MKRINQRTGFCRADTTSDEGKSIAEIYQPILDAL